MARFTVAVVGSLELLLAMVCSFFAANPWLDSMTVPIFGSRVIDTVVFVGATVFMSALSAGMYTRRAWAWWFSRFGSGLMFVVGVVMIGLVLSEEHTHFHVRLFYGCALTAGGGIVFALLSFPSTQKHFHRSRRRRKRRRPAARRRASESSDDVIR